MTSIIPRRLAPQLRAAARSFPIVTITGPRQSGKTTLCRSVFPRKAYANLEDPDVREFATQDPRGFLAQFRKGAILDEIQRVPDLLSHLQGDVDELRQPGRFILTGSQHFALLSRVSQSLAGRTAVLHLLPFGHDEVSGIASAPRELEPALLHGGYPAVLARGIAPGPWHASYVATYLERDVRQILNVGSLSTFQSFLGLVAGRSGQVVNLSALGADCGVTHDTARSWLSVLEASWLVLRLPAFHRNLRKRLVKSPKIHFLDTGLLCWLLGIRDAATLLSHPLRGAVFESWVASEIVKARVHDGLPPSLAFFRDQRGLEVDFMLETAGHLVAVEAKAGKTPSGDALDTIVALAGLLPRSAAESMLRLAVYGGDTRQDRDKGLILPWRELASVNWEKGTVRRRGRR